MSIRFYAAAGLMFASPAAAHGTFAAGSGFYAGLSHPFLTIEHLLLLLALGLFLGRGTAAERPLPLLSLALAMAGGLAAAAHVAVPPVMTDAVLALALLTGVALAFALPTAALPGAGLATAAGLLIGADTHVPLAATGGMVMTLAPFAGVLVGVFLVAGNAMALASVAVRPPFPIALRIAGSWIAAIALMVLALNLRTAGTPP